METYLVRRPSAWADMEELSVAGARSADLGETEFPDRISWIRSYVVKEADGRIGTLCVYQATDVASIIEHAARVGMPAENILPVVETVVVRADPIEVVEAA